MMLRYVAIECDALATETQQIQDAVYSLTGATLEVECVSSAAAFHRQFQLKHYDILFVSATITACYEKAYGYSVLLETQLTANCMMLWLSWRCSHLLTRLSLDVSNGPAAALWIKRASAATFNLGEARLGLLQTQQETSLTAWYYAVAARTSLETSIGQVSNRGM